MPEHPLAPSSVASSAAIEHLRWSLTPEVGPVLFGRLIECFGSAQQALGTSAAQLERVDGIGPTTADKIARGREAAEVEAEVELAARHGVRIICRDDAEYPRALLHIPDPPICLYVRGQIQPEDAVAVGIVGSRRCTLYGREQANRFGYQLASQGITVVSGLARGVDGESHKGAIAAGGRTLAVLGNGLSMIYPPEHQDLADRIVHQGAVLSELPMASSPNSGNFLPRNRLIAGLSLGVLVVEAARRSGSLTTGRLASEYNRELFALPGRVDSEYSQGTNALIRDQHAKCVTCAEDILEELGEVGQALSSGNDTPADEAVERAPAAVGLKVEEQLLCSALGRQEQSIEMLAEATSLPAGRIASMLITLQLRGLARQLPGNLFVRARGR
ncbi:MAG TPA: DNA-processing protein DprA [Phycisphaerae bacterium]|nr:DNA-processing protein DprA [Phycisphaerae bacterium]HRY69831.1 DNA-processing protein DprA [Phycisphaerae bacterium]HSA25442.1 DNA-processing protein DprA [Phycisphaerae bacterium]